MTYFTSWEINVFLCLLSMGLPPDLIRHWVKKMKKTHDKLEQKNAMEYHCDRGQFVDMTELQMVYFSRADLSDPEWHFPKAISELNSIPVEFDNLYSLPVSKILHLGISGVIQSVRKNFETAQSRGYINRRALEWSEGFHPGRFTLMNMKNKREKQPIIIRDLYSFGNWCRAIANDSKNTRQVPEYKKPLIEMDINRNGWCICEFIKNKDHIEDLFLD